MNTPRFFAVNETIENEIKSIKKDLYLSMNGICAENISDSGLKYDKSFGVAWSRICEIAQNYTPNYELSERLWLMPIRETKLIATLLCPPSDLTSERLKEWSEGITTVELAEIFSFSLLRKTKGLNNEIINMEHNEIELIRLTAYHTIARMISTMEIEEIKGAISSIKSKDICNISAFRAIESMLTNTIFKTKELNDLIIYILNKIKEENSPYVKQLVNNIEEIL